MLTAHVIDANNVRGAMRFPELSAFCCAVGRLAEAGSGLVILVVDHGLRPAAFVLSERFVIVFAGKLARVHAFASAPID